MNSSGHSENAGRENAGRDNPRRPLSTADLAAAAQRPETRTDARADQRTDRPTRPEQVRLEREARANRERANEDLRSGEDARSHRRDQLQDDEPTGTFQSPFAAERDSAASSTEVASSTERTSAETQRNQEARREALEPLFTPQLAENYRTRWNSIQSGFVDDPRQAVRAGDELVAQMMSNLANSFAEERRRVEEHLDQTGEGSTENLRVALRRYHSFFERLLSL